jgi:hypothetical protein
MDNHLTPEAQNVVVEDALQTYPFADMPRDITADVMARIQTIPAPRPFRIIWNDFGVALVLSLCIGAIWFSVQNFPPLLLAQIRMQSILFYQDLIVNVRWLIPAIFFGLAALLSALTIPYLRRNLAAK